MKRNSGVAVRSKALSVFGAQFSRSLLVIGIVAAFCAAMLAGFLAMERSDARDEASRSFQDSVSMADRYLDQLKYTLAEISMNTSMYPVVDGKLTNNFDYTKIIEAMRTSVFVRKQNEFAPYLDAIFIVLPERCDSIVDSSGTYRRDTFFTTQYKNSIYNDEFWLDEMQKEFVFKMYPSSKFDSVRNVALSEKNLTPIAYKLPANNNFIFVGLLDMNGILNSLTGGAAHNVAVFDQVGNLLLAPNSKCNFTSEFSMDGKAVKRAQGGYLFRVESPLNGLVYYRWVSNGDLFSAIDRIGVLFALLLIAATALAIFLAFIFARRDDRAVQRIGDALRGGGFDDDEELRALPSANLRFVQGGVDSLLARNDAYYKEITQKDSLLKAVFLQSRMRDIYVSIDDVENQLSISQNYVLLCFRVNFKEQFHQNIQEEQGKITFFLKQLIELYLSNAKLEATTFQIESDQIVSVVSLDQVEYEKIPGILDNIVLKLNNEGEYVFFTIVVSEPHENIAELKPLYDHLYAISKYAPPGDGDPGAARGRGQARRGSVLLQRRADGKALRHAPQRVCGGLCAVLRRNFGLQCKERGQRLRPVSAVYRGGQLRGQAGQPPVSHHAGHPQHRRGLQPAGQGSFTPPVPGSLRGADREDR